MYSALNIARRQLVRQAAVSSRGTLQLIVSAPRSLIGMFRLHRDPCIGRSLKVHHAGHVPHDDRRWDRQLEEEGGRGVLDG